MDTDSDNELFENLRKLRKEIALKEDEPAYTIFPDAALREICVKKPASLTELSVIPGVGRAKLGKYGDMILALIKEHKDKYGE